jgi:hypothetical protein
MLSLSSMCKHISRLRDKDRSDEGISEVEIILHAARGH